MCDRDTTRITFFLIIYKVIFVDSVVRLLLYDLIETVSSLTYLIGRGLDARSDKSRPLGGSTQNDLSREEKFHIKI